MDSLALPHAKLFHCIYEMSENGLISDQEKAQLKEMVALEHEGLFSVLAQFENDPALSEEILKIVRPTGRKKPQPVQMTRAYGDEISSPLGTFLLNKKKRQHEEHGLHLTLMNTADEPAQGGFKISLFGGTDTTE